MEVQHAADGTEEANGLVGAEDNKWDGTQDGPQESTQDEEEGEGRTEDGGTTAVGTRTETKSESEAETKSEAESEAETEAETEAVSVAGRRRTALLIACTAALGIVAGTCTGYVVQAGRTPTELPSLSQPALGQAKGPAPEPLSAAQDRQVKTEGDLRKLVLPRPKGARDDIGASSTDGWMSLGDYAETYEKPASAFEDLVFDGYRRGTDTIWREGSTHRVEIMLVQYGQDEKVIGPQAVHDQSYWAEQKPNTDSWPIDGTGDGMAYVHHDPERNPGYLDLYSAEAVAWRGDIVMEMWITDIKQIPKKEIVDLAERQMERL